MKATDTDTTICSDVAHANDRGFRCEGHHAHDVLNGDLLLSGRVGHWFASNVAEWPTTFDALTPHVAARVHPFPLGMPVHKAYHRTGNRTGVWLGSNTSQRSELLMCCCISLERPYRRDKLEMLRANGFVCDSDLKAVDSAYYERLASANRRRKYFEHAR
eukprot:3562923-Prymnesium_polylepis.2